MSVQKSLLAYEERYKKVYEAGGIFWHDHASPQELLEFVKELPIGAKCIEFGCGEGHEVRALAKLGFKVTGIDISPTVIQRNKTITPADLCVEYIVGDITDLRTIGIEDGSFDFALDIGCLHMLSEPVDRNSYLKEVKRVLKPGAFLYLQNGLSLEDVQPQDADQANELQKIKEFMQNYNSEKLMPRKIITTEGEREVMLPLCSTGKLLFLEEYLSELRELGFSIVYSKRSGGMNMSFEAIIIAST
ncbi:class I SAM-dependent methyltransferase [Anaerosinus massiliensis]|uniref:class I SAM-dependent methyltransferase n=1 Tax=Massilibacillus massiliensis TaxID=1806837 RepID=UPI000AE02DAE|nr:class I SAM-dependent methyltransferase [Massilibacillus massiliensis]